MTIQRPTVLAIESAICGGSISLIRNGTEIANWIGSETVSKAEDLLPNVDKVLTANYLSLHDLGLIGVSAGPGSFTGIRIGIATALGLCRALSVTLSSVSVLKAMVAAAKPETGHLTACVPVGRNAICLQDFRKVNGELTEMDGPQTLKDDDFFNYLGNEPKKYFVLHEALYIKVNPAPTKINLGKNLALTVGQFCLSHPHCEQVKPLFISKSF